MVETQKKTVIITVLRPHLELRPWSDLAITESPTYTEMNKFSIFKAKVNYVVFFWVHDEL
jgi:hypothetical protein